MKEKTIENAKKAKHYRTNQIAKPEMMQKRKNTTAISTEVEI